MKNQKQKTTVFSIESVLKSELTNHIELYICIRERRLPQQGGLSMKQNFRNL